MRAGFHVRGGVGRPGATILRRWCATAVQADAPESTLLSLDFTLLAIARLSVTSDEWRAWFARSGRVWSRLRLGWLGIRLGEGAGTFRIRGQRGLDRGVGGRRGGHQVFVGAFGGSDGDAIRRGRGDTALVVRIALGRSAGRRAQGALSDAPVLVLPAFGAAFREPELMSAFRDLFVSGRIHGEGFRMEGGR